MSGGRAIVQFRLLRRAGIQQTTELPAAGSRQKAGALMSSNPAIAGRTLRYRTLRYWTINSQEFVGGSQRLAPALPYSEQADGGQFHRLASELTRVKSELARRAS
jgi:hypothetical protein